MSNTAAAVEFLKMVAGGDVLDAFSRHVAQHFTHHNPCLAHARQSLLDAMSQSAAAEPNNPQRKPGVCLLRGSQHRN